MSPVQAHGPTSWLLQLPEAALASVLQQLDSCSLANTALSCTALSHAVPGSISTLEVCCRRPDKLRSLALWLKSQCDSLNNVKKCSVERVTGHFGRPTYKQAVLRRLPCPGLRQLRLQGLKLQLDAAAGWPGVLGACTALTSLDVRHCLICDTPAASAAAAVAALPELQDLRLVDNWDLQGRYPFAAAQYPTSLTQLRLGFEEAVKKYPKHLSQLSGLVNLQHLELTWLSRQGVPGGLPPQLVKLTCLHMQYKSKGDTAEQFQHLSALTALQQLSIKFDFMLDAQCAPGDLCGIAHLVQLTSLELATSEAYHVTADSTTTWSRLTALHSMSLSDVYLQPSALPPLAQLQSLSLKSVLLSEDATLQELLVAVSHLTLLTQLHVELEFDGLNEQQPLPPAAAFTALTASTHLRSLKVDLRESEAVIPPDLELFRPHTLYPHLSRVHLDSIAPGEQQLQRLCSCCPALKSLVFVLDGSLAPTACLPLLQLSALTSLQVLIASTAACTAAGLPDVAAQLTGLRRLAIRCFDYEVHVVDIPAPALLQLTALTALESLAVDGAHPGLDLENKADSGNPPDVWIQLQQHLMRDAT